MLNTETIVPWGATFRPCVRAKATMGHNAAAIASLEDTILVVTQRMRGVEVDVEAQTARVQAGTLWLEVTEASAPHGLFPLSGSSPDVGVVGYTLGGGLSWLAREHGLEANNVTAIELVTPDGALVRATADDHADLFWALRGGGGNFGVVTAMDFRLFPYGQVYAGMFLFPYERGGEVLRAWHAWTLTAPEGITTSMRIMHMPPPPELPDFLRGRSIAVIDGAFAGGEEAGAEAVAALRALAPELHTWGMADAAALSRLHMDPEEPMPYAGASIMLGALDDGEAFLAALAPYESGAAYLNFVERPTDTSAFYTDDAYARLRSIRAAVDPDGLMVGNHPIPAASGQRGVCSRSAVRVASTFAPLPAITRRTAPGASVRSAATTT